MTRNAPHCPACAAGETRIWFQKQEFDHWRCARCGHGFVFPVPPVAEIDAYYRALNSGLSSDCSWETEAAHKAVLWRHLLGQVARNSGTGPLLDLGCGGGQFLQVALQAGWHDLHGVEPSPKAAGIARSNVTVPIHLGGWRDVELPFNSFAGVALFDVLEHEPEPHALLRHCCTLLRPGGSLMLTVPNRNGISIRCFGRNACVVIPPEHLSYFSSTSLRRMLESAGFESSQTTTCDVYLKEWLRFDFLSRTPVKAETRPDIQQKENYQRWRRRLSGGLALSGISVANRILAVFGCGDQLVAIARKPAECVTHV